MLPAILTVLENVEDPRINRTRRHSLTALLARALCAVRCGADSWVQIEAYGKAKQAWFSQWLDVPCGIPSHDTFARVFSLLKPAVLRACLQATAQALCDGDEKQIALDGKDLRHSFTRLLFEHAAAHQFEDAPHQTHTETTVAHGRVETRSATQINLSDLQGRWDDMSDKWSGLASLLRIESTRQVGEKTTQETRYFISSLHGDVKRAARRARRYGGIENRLHWGIDMAFNEDACRVRKDHALASFAIRVVNSGR